MEEEQKEVQLAAGPEPLLLTPSQQASPSNPNTHQGLIKVNQIKRASSLAASTLRMAAVHLSLNCILERKLM